MKSSKAQFRPPWMLPYLADTSVRVFSRKDGRSAVRLRSYLMIPVRPPGFRLSAHLRDTRMNLEFSSGHVIEFESVSWSEDSRYELDVMMHDLWAVFIGDVGKVRDGVGRLWLDYHISFTGHPSEEPGRFEALVPVLDRSWKPWRLPWGEPTSELQARLRAKRRNRG